MAAEAVLQAQRDLIDKWNELVIPLLTCLTLPLGTTAFSFHLPLGQIWAKLQRTTEDICLYPFSVAPSSSLVNPCSSATKWQLHAPIPGLLFTSFQLDLTVSAQVIRAKILTVALKRGLALYLFTVSLFKRPSSKGYLSHRFQRSWQNSRNQWERFPSPQVTTLEPPPLGGEKPWMHAFLSECGLQASCIRGSCDAGKVHIFCPLPRVIQSLSRGFQDSTLLNLSSVRFWGTWRESLAIELEAFLPVIWVFQ